MAVLSRRAAVTLTFGGLTGAFVSAYLLKDKQHRELNPTSFTPFTLSARESVSSTSSILTLQSSSSLAELNKKFDQAHPWSVEISQPQLQIARSYTPLPSLDYSNEEQKDQLRFLIRREDRGEVSTFLHRLPLGATVELRGPSDDLNLPDDIDQVIFLAGGTGIAPALQVANSLRDKARVAILWANRKREDCTGGQSDDSGASAAPWYLSIWGTGARRETEEIRRHPIVSQLDVLKARSSSRLRVDYCVDEESSYITTKRIKQLMRSNHEFDTNLPKSKAIIISGPEGFVNHWAGPKLWTNGRQVQGPIGGQLGRMDLDGWHVFKL